MIDSIVDNFSRELTIFLKFFDLLIDKMFELVDTKWLVKGSFNMTA